MCIWVFVPKMKFPETSRNQIVFVSNFKMDLHATDGGDWRNISGQCTGSQLN